MKTDRRTFAAVAVVMALAGVAAPSAHADRSSFSCVLDQGTSCTVIAPWRHIHTVNAWYRGSQEIVVGASMQENVDGEWAEARNRSNNVSFVNLYSFCGACWYRAKLWNWGPGRHTINGQYWWNP